MRHWTCKDLPRQVGWQKQLEGWVRVEQGQGGGKELRRKLNGMKMLLEGVDLAVMTHVVSSLAAVSLLYSQLGLPLGKSLA